MTWIYKQYLFRRRCRCVVSDKPEKKKYFFLPGKCNKLKEIFPQPQTIEKIYKCQNEKIKI